MKGYSIPTSEQGRQSPGAGQVVAHCATPFLTETGAWIYHQISPLQRWRPIVFTQEASNQDQFPVRSLVDAERWSLPTRAVNRVVRRLTGEYPFYGRRMARAGVDLIHAHFGYQGCRCLRAQRQTQLPLITTFYGADATSFARDPAWQRRYLRLFERGALFLAEGSAMRRQLLSLGCPQERLLVHHLGVDTTRIQCTPRQPTTTPQILMCGSFREKKGFDDGLHAIGRALEGLGAAAAGVRVVLIGDGPQRPQIESAIRASGLVGRVELPGVLPYIDLINVLHQSHLMIVPSRTASDGDTEGGAPVILLDAQAAGVPIVATRHADIPEYVADGVSGLLAEERDIDGLACHIGALLREPERWAPMGMAGRQHVVDGYDAVRQCSRLEEIYDAVAAGRVDQISSSLDNSGPARDSFGSL